MVNLKLNRSVKVSTLALCSILACPFASANTTITQEDSHLFFVESDVAMWQERAQSGPYQNRSDVSANSPGDWDKVLENYQAFMNISGERDALPSPDLKYNDDGQAVDACYRVMSDIHYNDFAAQIRDAAFYSLIKGDTDTRDAVKASFLALAQNPTFDFTNSEKWCSGEMNDGGFGFHFAEWIARLVVAYDFIKQELSADEQQVILHWFNNYAYYAREDLLMGLRTLFTYRSETYEHRDKLDYSRKEGYTHEDRHPVFVSDPYNLITAPEVPRIGYFYNNRRAQFARTLSMIGILVQDPDLKNDGVQYCEEYLMFGVTPQGYPIEFERNRFTHREVGYQYSMQALGACLTVASVAARLGDDYLLNFSTTAGYEPEGDEKSTPTAGKPDDFPGKSLEFMAVSMARHLDRTYQRYYYVEPDAKNPFNLDYDQIPVEEFDDYIIDGYEPQTKSVTKNDDGYVTSVTYNSSWDSVADTVFADINQFWDNQYLRDIYFRDQAELRPYASSPAGFGSHYGFGGDSSIFPGVMFMYAQNKPEILALHLYNPANDSFSEIDSAELTLSAEDFPDGFSIVAKETLDDEYGYIGSVEFFIDEVKHRRENVSPFCLNGDQNNTTPYSLVLPQGTYSISMMPYRYKSAGGAQGDPVTVQVTVQ